MPLRSTFFSVVPAATPFSADFFSAEAIGS